MAKSHECPDGYIYDEEQGRCVLDIGRQEPSMEDSEESPDEEDAE